MCDAALAWYTRVQKELQHLSVKRYSLDKSLFFWYKESTLQGIICVYIDDFLWAGTESFEKQVISEIRELISVGHALSESFKYVGLNLHTSNNGVSIDQYHYVSILTPIKISQVFSQLTKSQTIVLFWVS